MLLSNRERFEHWGIRDFDSFSSKSEKRKTEWYNKKKLTDYETQA